MDAVHSIEPGAEVSVVDNNSSDETVSLLRGTVIRLISNDRNVGFGHACNIGAAASERPFVFFLNPDARLRPGALNRLVQFAQSQQQYAALNPRILGPDGEQTQRRMSRLLSPEVNATLRAPLKKDTDVEMLSGAALFCRRDDFEAIGGFDEKIFLYFEDDDLLVRFRKAGRRLGYVHDAIVEHIGGASSQATSTLEEFKLYHFMKANRYAMGKHGIVFDRGYQIFLCTSKFVLRTLTLNRRQQSKYRGYLKALLEAA